MCLWLLHIALFTSVVLKLTLEAFSIWFSLPFEEVSICGYSVLPKLKPSKYSLIHLLFNTTLEHCPELSGKYKHLEHTYLSIPPDQKHQKKLSVEYKTLSCRLDIGWQFSITLCFPRHLSSASLPTTAQGSLKIRVMLLILWHPGRWCVVHSSLRNNDHIIKCVSTVCQAYYRYFSSLLLRFSAGWLWWF